MADLSTSYLGLPLRNPLIVSSCSLTKHADGVARCADAGAGAVVLKSLFEEQIAVETASVSDHLWMGDHPEAFAYVQGMGMELGPRDYLTVIEQAKARVDIPVIASLNCITPRWWLGYARQLAEAGADALELNVSALPTSPGRTGAEVEQLYEDVVHGVSEATGLPLAVKLGPYFSSLPNLALRLSDAGADALVLFNRFYQLDIDARRMELRPGYRFSTRSELSLPLRWIALLSGRIRAQLSATTGVHDGEDAAKLLLAGADTVQVCSALYLHGLERLRYILDGLDSYMESQGVPDVAALRGRLAQSASERGETYERLQYIGALVGIE